MGTPRRARKRTLMRLYDAEAEKYELRYGAEQAPKVRDALAMIPPKYPALDVGCGTGILLRSLSHLAVGLDISRSMLSRAPGGPLRERVLGDMERMPFRADSFWSIYSITSIQLAGDLRRAVLEMARVAKGGGFVLISAHRATSASRELADAALAAGLIVLKDKPPDDADVDRVVACMKPPVAAIDR